MAPLFLARLSTTLASLLPSTIVLLKACALYRTASSPFYHMYPNTIVASRYAYWCSL